tara:strand:+ start:259 stop:1278 length:1020 start_codon:yes stop_codon:yes gene_type:complete
MFSRTKIIAEAGVNHNGSLERAKQLIKIAAESGADVVKFQTFSASKIASESTPLADYQQNNNLIKNQLELLSSLEIPYNWYQELLNYSKKLNIEFASTAFEIDGVDFLDDLGQCFFKIASGELTNKPLIEHIAKKGKKIIISTGMANVDEINEALNLCYNHGVSKNDVTLLHCNTQYPSPYEDLNLNAIGAMRSTFGVDVGYSDHSLGIEVPIACVSLGATVIEKHFTIDRNDIGPDHAASIEPHELKKMIESIRNIEKAISGSGHKTPSKSEVKNRVIARRSIHLVKDVLKGAVIKSNDLMMMRPGDGISPMQLNEIIGKKYTMDLPNGTKLKWENIQ